jgi:hypothetical protein
MSYFPFKNSTKERESGGRLGVECEEGEEERKRRMKKEYKRKERESEERGRDLGG